MFHFSKAERKRSKLRLALCGPSGSGKTYSALLIAQGLANGGRVAMLDTERGSGELYADLTGFDVAGLRPPFDPAKYIEAIWQAEKEGYEVLIIDSLSHAWSGTGGVLDMHDKAAAATRNTFTAWREVTPHHNALVDAMLCSDLHVIVTMRTKTAYEVIEESGKKKPIKIGMAPVQREGMEYEFTLLLDLSMEGHLATASKDRTRLFDGSHFLPSVRTGEHLRAWLEAGAVPVPKAPPVFGAPSAPVFAAPPAPESASPQLPLPESPPAAPVVTTPLLARLFKEATAQTSLPALLQWWRANEGQIAKLNLNEHARLSAHCGILKQAHNAVLAKSRLGRASKGNGSEATV